jgi:hypothetical protein
MGYLNQQDQAMEENNRSSLLTSINDYMAVLMRKVDSQIEFRVKSQKMINENLRENCSNVLLLVIDSFVSDDHGLTIEEITNKIANIVLHNESVCDTHQTYYFRDRYPEKSDWLVMKKREESENQVKKYKGVFNNF